MSGSTAQESEQQAFASLFLYLCLRKGQGSPCSSSVFGKSTMGTVPQAKKVVWKLSWMLAVQNMAFGREQPLLNA